MPDEKKPATGSTDELHAPPREAGASRLSDDLGVTFLAPLTPRQAASPKGAPPKGAGHAAEISAEEAHRMLGLAMDEEEG